jgi:hypothetical protein
MIPNVRQLCQDSADCKAILGDPVRIYRHGRKPQDVPAPYAVFSMVSGLPHNNLSDLPPGDRVVIQIDHYVEQAPNGDQLIETLAKATRDAIEPHAHMTGIVFDGVEPSTKRFRISTQFDFLLSR